MLISFGIQLPHGINRSDLSSKIEPIKWYEDDYAYFILTSLTVIIIYRISPVLLPGHRPTQTSLLSLLENTS